MWYFAWVLGVSLAAAFAILNALWFEVRILPKEQPQSGQLSLDL